jgi:hypothetical protein
MNRTTVQRPTSSIHHHRALSAAAATGLVGTLLAVTLGSASAMPVRGDPPPAPVPAVHTHHGHGHYVAHGCFITLHNLNEAEVEELPVCYTYVG